MEPDHTSPEQRKRKKKKKTVDYEVFSGSDDTPSPKKKKSEKAAGSAASESTASAAVATKNKGRHYTVSLALPGSIISNAQSPELKAYLAGQIARALVVFSVDEVVIFDETSVVDHKQPHSKPNTFLGRLLHYLETPQYLRKSFFGHHQDLRFAGLLNPLDTPHHMRMEEVVDYREGVVLNRPAKTSGNAGSYVNCGLRKEVRIDKVIAPGVRVTVRMQNEHKPDSSTAFGTVVSPSEPRTVAGIYWGYQVRYARHFGAVFSESPHKGGYDLTIGTSERGKSIDDVDNLPGFKHALVVFGGVQGLEFSLESDESLHVDDVSQLFDCWLNTCPVQGSRTIRTEEAILISLAALRPKLSDSGWNPS